MQHQLEVLPFRGTSDNAAQFGRYLIEITTRIPVSLAAPSILTLYECSLDLTEVLVVGISQSGESTDTNAVLEDARIRGAITVGITNEPHGSMAHLAEYTLLVRAGREESVSATKTYTCQLLALYLLAHALGGAVDLEVLHQLPDWVYRVLQLEERVCEIAERYTFMTRAVTVGRGLNYANALEFGLKLMETCYVVAERFSSADLMHGPIAWVERSFPVFVFAPAGVTWPSMAAVLDRLEELKAETLVITDDGNAQACAKPARLIRLPIQGVFSDGPATCIRRSPTSSPRNCLPPNWRTSRASTRTARGPSRRSPGPCRIESCTLPERTAMTPWPTAARARAACCCPPFPLASGITLAEWTAWRTAGLWCAGPSISVLRTSTWRIITVRPTAQQKRPSGKCSAWIWGRTGTS
ncbi:MAG: SIS domain-containing protein [Acidobacteriia bacterium]|nr:SIS domain-containing protein [Terriglobia bacterium]